jgi:hypothetical protein
VEWVERVPVEHAQQSPRRDGRGLGDEGAAVLGLHPPLEPRPAGEPQLAVEAKKMRCRCRLDPPEVHRLSGVELRRIESSALRAGSPESAIQKPLEPIDGVPGWPAPLPAEAGHHFEHRLWSCIHAHRSRIPNESFHVRVVTRRRRGSRTAPAGFDSPLLGRGQGKLESTPVGHWNHLGEVAVSAGASCLQGPFHTLDQRTGQGGGDRCP